MKTKAISSFLALIVCLVMVIPARPQSMVVYVTQPPQIIQANLLAYYSFTEGYEQRVFNRLGPMTYPTTLNIFGWGGEQIANDNLAADGWNKGGSVTLTDFAATDFIGSTNATRAQFGGGGTFIYRQPQLSTVAYTISAYVKSNTGSTQAMRFLTTAGFSSDKSVTTTWTRVSETFTPGTSGVKTIGIAEDAASDASDILLWGIKLEIGSAPTAYVSPVSDLQLGTDPRSDLTDPSWNVQGLAFASGKSAYGIRPSTVSSQSNISVYAVVKKTGSDLTSGMEPIISERYGAEIFHLASADIDGTGSGVGGPVKFPTFMFNSARTCAYSIILNDGNYHLLTGTYDGTTLRLYMDAIEIASKDVCLSAQTIRRLYLSRFSSRDDGTVYFPGIIPAGAIYSVAHSQSDINTNFAAFKGIMASRSIVINKPTKWIAIEGDSLSDPIGTAPYGSDISNGWGYQFFHELSPVIPGQNFARSGWNLQPGPTSIANTAKYTDIDSTYDSARSVNLLILNIGVNDMNTSITPSDFVSQLKTYCLARKAIGWKVAVWTLPPNNFTGGNAKRNSINSLIRADSDFSNGVAADVITDVGGDPIIGPDAAQADSSLYSDGVHLTAIGQARLKLIIKTAVSPLL